MLEAARARDELAGDPSYPVGIVMVKGDEIVARAGNGFNRGKQIHVCPRIVFESPTGTGYDLCHLHDSSGHAERQVIEEAQKQGIDPAGCDLYLLGHWWACEPCWNAMIEAGIRDVFLLDDAHERFSRDRVYAQMLVPSFKTISLEGIEGGLLKELLGMLQELGLKRVESGAEVRCVATKGTINCFFSDIVDPVFIVEQGSEAGKQIKNVLKQL
jgi:deoxycytidylate deaminase